MDSVEVLLGNHCAIQGHKQEDGSVTYSVMPGPQICRMLIPEPLLANVTATAQSIRATLPKHMTGNPDWVESANEQLCTALSQLLQVPTPRPANWGEATHEN